MRRSHSRRERGRRVAWSSLGRPFRRDPAGHRAKGGWISVRRRIVTGLALLGLVLGAGSAGAVVEAIVLPRGHAVTFAVIEDSGAASTAASIRQTSLRASTATQGRTPRSVSRG